MCLRARKCWIDKWQIILCLPEDYNLLNGRQSWQGVNSSYLLGCLVPCQPVCQTGIKLTLSRLSAVVCVDSKSFSFRPLVLGQSNLYTLPWGQRVGEYKNPEDLVTCAGENPSG